MVVCCACFQVDRDSTVKVSLFLYDIAKEKCSITSSSFAFDVRMRLVDTKSSNIIDGLDASEGMSPFYRFKLLPLMGPAVLAASPFFFPSHKTSP